MLNFEGDANADVKCEQAFKNCISKRYGYGKFDNDQEMLDQKYRRKKTTKLNVIYLSLYLSLHPGNLLHLEYPPVQVLLSSLFSLQYIYLKGDSLQLKCFMTSLNG